MMNRNDNHGFSLIEIVFSLALLTVTVSCLLTALPVALKNSADAEHLATAGRIAESWSAELRAFGRLRQPAGTTALTVSGGESLNHLALDEAGHILRLINAEIFTSGEPSAKFIAA
ncbi:MAG: hypothetical protein LBD30_07220, partial [Verrucomicrobiales bacterium]|nr:hypothetical protein [Verrucomicrobiales bacterium]